MTVYWIFICFSSKFEEPSESEGIDEIVKINFVPDFKDSKHETLYKMYLLWYLMIFKIW